MNSTRRPHALLPHRRLSGLRLGIVLVAALMVSACVVAPPQRVAPGQVYRTAPEPVGTPMYFYPNEGQSPEQQDRDRFEC